MPAQEQQPASNQLTLIAFDSQEAAIKIDSIKSQSTVRRQLKQPARQAVAVNAKETSDDYEANKTYLTIKHVQRKDGHNAIHEESDSSSDESGEAQDAKIDVKRQTNLDGVTGSNILLSLN